MELVVAPGGTVRAIYAEEIDLGALGRLSITRASHVEPDPTGRWLADLAPVAGPVLGPFERRSEALAAEQAWLDEHWLARSDRSSLSRSRSISLPTVRYSPSDPNLDPASARAPRLPVRLRRRPRRALRQKESTMTQSQLDRSVASATGEPHQARPTARLQPARGRSRRPRTRGPRAGRRLPVLRPARALSRSGPRRLGALADVIAATSTSISRSTRSTRLATESRAGSVAASSRPRQDPWLVASGPNSKRRSACRVPVIGRIVPSFTHHPSSARIHHLDHHHPPCGQTPAGRLSPLRPGHHPPRRDPAAGAARRGPRNYGRNIGTTTWPSSTSRPDRHHLLDSIPVPLDALADFEGRDETPVVLEAAEPDRTVVRWQDHGIPQTREYAVTPFGKLEPFPETPTAWTDISGDVLDALAEASRTCADDSTRYALDCIQLRGTAHKIVATDGRQLLVRSGFGFPWDGDLLSRARPSSPARSCPATGRSGSARRTRTSCSASVPGRPVMRSRKDARFPGVEERIPDQDALPTRLRLDTRGRPLPRAALDRLPGERGAEQPGHARPQRQGRDPGRGLPITSQITELVLNRSSYSGPAIRINTNRRFLSRALQLGFRRDRHRRRRGADRLPGSSIASTPGSR